MLHLHLFRPRGAEKKMTASPPLNREGCYGCDGLGPGGRKKRTAFPPPNGGNVLHLHGYMPPVANRKTDRIPPFC